MAQYCQVAFDEDDVRIACQQPGCPRVNLRMACPECEYPFSEACYPLDTQVPHREHTI